MSDGEVEKLKKLLRSALGPQDDAQLRRDLWPTVMRRLENRHSHVSRWDWALLAGVIAVICLFPEVIPALLYHL
jgi:hypothetical protein